MKKQASVERESKGRKLQLHKETLQTLFSANAGGTVTQYTCPDTTGMAAAICAG